MKKAYRKWLKEYVWVSAAMARFGELAFAAGVAFERVRARHRFPVKKVRR
jgi:hypothetical protein